MRIYLILHEHLDPNSGSAGSTLSIGRCYETFGHDVDYFSNDDLPDFLSRHCKRLLFPIFVAYYLVKNLAEKSIDVVDSSPCDTWLWLLLVRRFYKNTPLVVTRSHGLLHFDHIEYKNDGKLGNVQISWKYPLYHGSFHLWEEEYTLRNSNAVFMLNSQEANYGQDDLNINPDQVHVFSNGIPQHFLDLPFEDTPFSSGSPLRIAQIGTFTQRKGIDYSAPALNRILERFESVQVSFIGTELNGEGDVESVYSLFSKSIHDRIQVVPYYVHDTLPILLKGHHIKLFPTLSEGFGKVLIESMACGLAPITTMAPGPKDIVVDGHDAVIVPMRNSQAIEEAVERLICDRQYLDDIRKNAYVTAQSYDWNIIAQKRLLAYEQALVKSC